MNWLQRLATKPQTDFVDITDGEDAARSAAAMTYYSIGHGELNEESGQEPKYLAWVYLDGIVQTTNIGDPQLETYCDTHGMKWGHDKCNQTYKGRYEPETGRLSIIIPEKHKFRDVPNVIMADLYRKFPNITKVTIFR